MARKLTKEEFIEKARIVHGNIYGYDYVEYVKSSQKVAIVCSKHGVFFQTPSSHLSARGCKKCSTENTHKKQIKSNCSFIRECIEKFGDLFDYTLTRYEGANKKIQVKCVKHGHFIVTARSHLKGNGSCPECHYEGLSSKFSSNLNQFISKAIDVHGEKYSYHNVIYSRSWKKVSVFCKLHREYFSVSPNNHLRGKGCPTCNSSKGETRIRNFLNHRNIRFQEQQSFDECLYKRKLKFDFYLKEYNILVEFQGEQHYKNCNIFHSKNGKSLKVQQIIDQIKWEYCREKNIKLIEIPYWSFNEIDEILHREIKYEG